MREGLHVASEYIPILLFIIIAIGFGAIALGLPMLLGPTRKNDAKLEIYESGIIPFANAQRRVPIKYYLIAMLFLLFDIEVIFTYPWAVILRQLRDGWSVGLALAPMGFFMLVLIVGLIYEWRKGALNWE